MSYAVSVQMNSISHALVLSPTPKGACRMRTTGHVAAVALDHGNSLRRRQPIARPHSESFPDLQIDGNIRKL